MLLLWLDMDYSFFIRVRLCFIHQKLFAKVLDGTAGQRTKSASKMSRANERERERENENHIKLLLVWI